MTIESANRGAISGRLFNRAAISQGNQFDDPFDRPWFARQDTTLGGAAGFSPQFGEIHKSPNSVLSKIPEGNEKLRETRVDFESNYNNKKTNFQDDRERIDEVTDRAKNKLLLVVEPPTSYSKNKTYNAQKSLKKNPQSKGGLTGIPSAMTSGKRSRQHLNNKVAFSGEQILLKKSHQTDIVLHCEFVDLVKIFYISHFSEYSKAVSESLWYTRDEIEEMKKNYFYWKRMSRKGERRGSVARKLSSEGRSHNLRHLRHKKTMAIVLQEQERQRHMCQRIYGRIIDSFGNQRSGSCIIDRERLKEVYRRAGNTLKRQQEAIERASANHHLDVYFSKIRKENVESQYQTGTPGTATTTTRSTTTTSTSSSTTRITQNVYMQQPREGKYQEEQAIEEWTSIEASYAKVCFDLSTSFRDSIGCVFFTLLTPFLEQRRESSLFLEIGEEMIVPSY